MRTNNFGKLSYSLRMARYFPVFCQGDCEAIYHLAALLVVLTVGLLIQGVGGEPAVPPPHVTAPHPVNSGGDHGDHYQHQDYQVYNVYIAPPAK